MFPIGYFLSALPNIGQPPISPYPLCPRGAMWLTPENMEYGTCLVRRMGCAAVHTVEKGKETSIHPKEGTIDKAI